MAGRYRVLLCGAVAAGFRSASSARGPAAVGGQAEVLVPDIQTANATVHLIDAVMLPPAG
jgi:uncharacterized surface protein with fasciclin (FAS1) repeats